jgi:RNA polymerase sigma factor (sigma-70 family)
MELITDPDDVTAGALPTGTRSAGDEPTDAELIARSASEPSYFAAVFERHADEILRYIHARLGPDLAEDVSAETFLAAFRQRDRYDPGRADARPWLYGIAVRQISNRRRAEARYLRLQKSALPDLPAADIGDLATDRVAAERLRPQLYAVLAGLRPIDRELLLLVAWAGLSYEESATALGITVSAVKSRLSRVRARTRAALGHDNPVTRADEE